MVGPKWRRLGCVGVVVLGALQLGCSRSSAPQAGAAGAAASSLAPNAASAAATGSAALAAPSASAAVALASPAPSAVGAAETDNALRLKKYWAAMGQGRQATVKQAFSQALEAFDRALALLPDDARAYAERGYAHLLAKSYAAARDDFDRAALRTDDPVLLAQIWFNYGLTAEQEGRADDARSAFARSDELNHTKAAADKLGGSSRCTARFSQERTGGGAAPPPPNGDYLDLFKALAAEGKPAKLATTADEARALLCPLASCVPKSGEGVPLRLNVGSTTWYGAAFGRDDGTLRLFHRLGKLDDGQCGSKTTFTIEHQKPLHFRIEHSPQVEVFRTASGDYCKEGGADECVRRCVSATRLIEDMLFNVAGESALLRVSQWESPGSKPRWDIKVSGSAARIVGGGCDFTWDLK